MFEIVNSIKASDQASSLNSFSCLFNAKQGRHQEAEAILEKIYPLQEVSGEIEALRQSVEDEIAEEGSAGEKDILTKLRNLWKNTVVRRGLRAGIGCQVAQQFVGINSVMYYAPTIVQLAGFASNKTALALSLITSGLNALGTIVSMYFVDRAGRRRLLLTSLVGIILCLVLLTGIFAGASKNSPNVGSYETSSFGNNMTCPNYKMNPSARWTCVKCLKASAHCGFCAHSGNKVTNIHFLSDTCSQTNFPIFGMLGFFYLMELVMLM